MIDLSIVSVYEKNINIDLSFKSKIIQWVNIGLIYIYIFCFVYFLLVVSEIEKKR